MPLKLNEWVVVGSAAQTKPIATSQGTVNFTLTYYLEAMLTSQSVAQNLSQCKTRGRVTRSGGATYSSSMYATASGCPVFSGVATPDTVLTTGNVTLYHEDNGEAALLMEGDLTAVIGGFSISIRNAWMAAPTIPRASKPTFSNDPLTIGETQTITTNRKSDSFTHSITLTLGDYSETLTNVGASTTWTPSESLMEYMDTWQKTVTVTCTTYNGNTQVGSTTSSFVLQVDTDEYKPVVSTSVTDVGMTASYETDGSFIRKYSMVQATIDVSLNTGDYDYKLNSMTATLGTESQTYDLCTLDEGEVMSVLFTKGINTATELVVAITDSLGRISTFTTALTVIPYEDIIINTIKLERVNANGNPSDTGEYVFYDIDMNVWWGTFGKLNNNIGGLAHYKLAVDPTYEDSAAMQNVQTTGTGEFKNVHVTGILQNATFDSSTQYDLLFHVEDAFSSASFTRLRLLEGLPFIAIESGGAGIYGDLHIHDRENVHQYSTFTPTGYHWNLLGTATASNAVAFDSSPYSEIMLILEYAENATYTWATSTTIPVAELSTNYLYCMMPARIAPTSASDFGGVVRIKLDSANAFEFVANRASQTPTLKVYAR